MQKMAGEIQLEKKRVGTEESQFQEKPKRQKKPAIDDDSDDWFLYEGDSDSDPEDDYTVPYREVGRRYGAQQDPMIEDDKDDSERLSCLKVHVCNKDEHEPEFNGLPFFELFKLRLQFNEPATNFNGIAGKLYGVIVTFASDHYSIPEMHHDLDNPDPITYYCVRPEKPGSVLNLDSNNKKYFILIPISGPTPRPPINLECILRVDFALNLDGEDIFRVGYRDVNSPLYGKDTPKAEMLYVTPSDFFDLKNCPYGPRIVREVIGSPYRHHILLGAYYTVYDDAVWASVEVKMLKKGVSSFHGVIMARPCTVHHRIRLLTIHPHDDKGGEVESDSIKLTREVVVVPTNSYLIIGAKLYNHEDSKLICCGKTAFRANELGEETNCISYNGVETLQVTVKWHCLPEERGRI